MPIPNSEFVALRKRAAELMLTHHLPMTVSKTLLAGYGNGSACSLCAQPISHKQIEYELTDAALTRDGIRLHLWCHAAWQLELAKVLNA